ncbi:MULTISPECIES: DNA-3-methyladenine glycosylase [Sulfitobacter]|uniref:DNA-3-methyladenine glycosylase family protein n=1 Tax=Sulfitobacter TaxID=60136 RepID=UPI00230701F3|nr:MULTISPECIES: DNA-3-methyladenine glycosylase 2 family protein [Sulfitobacter]MDF3382680.1 DNA-3-methyladenine glycosylase 2 family protein [Sulfitobacter sp. Ks11]MDF3386099.1 DNA-3-methyladenine glycosylase 2 family protein [Sulfitobacter sp. M85]MDF3389518.1 DNA-3-methyladenine glycosylase 2 family protein [Sulfitobacter sp. Ks16]MDF3400155.1 DNA-3-methyladenine glycosylase 2 family protein [Sulfitobacter sp. KE39]MDF3403576.1 DNA-3-methyladenine glycosylase 2 family protein [Sulfitobact
MSLAPPITCDADVAEGAAWLAEREPRFAMALSKTGPLPLRLRPPGFAGLLDIIVGQQVSVASARAIYARLVAAGLDQPENVLRAGDDGLRAAGLSRPKARYVLALAERDFDFDALHGLPDDEAIAALVDMPGIGPWTAQIYVMFCLGRRDIFPSGDLALQEAARGLFDLPVRPSPKDLSAMAAAWSPWRSVAARLLFAYYRVLKQKEGLS